LANTSGQPASTADLTQAFLESFEETNTDAVLLHAGSPAELASEAKSRSCDLVLVSTLSEMKRPGRGMLGKISGTPADGLSAKIDFSLIAPGDAKPSFQASERSGTSMVQTAVGVAKRASQFMSPFAMARFGALRVFAAMGTNAPGMMQQTQDPMLST